MKDTISRKRAIAELEQYRMPEEEAVGWDIWNECLDLIEEVLGELPDTEEEEKK